MAARTTKYGFYQNIPIARKEQKYGFVNHVCRGYSWFMNEVGMIRRNRNKVNDRFRGN